jgi:hypothetical protein
MTNSHRPQAATHDETSRRAAAAIWLAKRQIAAVLDSRNRCRAADAHVGCRLCAGSAGYLLKENPDERTRSL